MGENFPFLKTNIIIHIASTTPSRCRALSAKSLTRFLGRSSLQDRSNLHLGSYTRLPTLRPDRSILKMTRTNRNTMKGYMLGIKEDMAGIVVAMEGTKEDTAGIEVATAVTKADTVRTEVVVEGTKEDTAGIEVATAVTKADTVRTEVI